MVKSELSMWFLTKLFLNNIINKYAKKRIKIVTKDYNLHVAKALHEKQIKKYLRVIRKNHFLVEEK